MMGPWRTPHILVLVATVLFVIALVAANAWTSSISNWPAWTTAGLGVFAASFLPWRTAP